MATVNKEEKFARLKKEYDEKVKESAFIKGQIEASMERLSREYGCKSIADAKKLLKSLKAEQKKIEERIEALIQKVESIINE